MQCKLTSGVTPTVTNLLRAKNVLLNLVRLKIGISVNANGSKLPLKVPEMGLLRVLIRSVPVLGAAKM